MEHASVSVIIPTKNSKNLLKRHIKDLVEISDDVIETIVVDSSNDGETVDFLKQNLPEKTTRYFSVPPGLYKAWNTAIKEATASFVYVATSGDRMDLNNFRKLYSAARELNTDVIVSAPKFVDEDNASLKHKWPIHRYLENTPLDEPKILPVLHVAAYNVLLFPTTLIGSSASNMYKTSFLKDYLFPTDCVAQGDSVWAAMHCLDAKWGIHPTCVSDFVIHESTSNNNSNPRRDLKNHQLKKISDFLKENEQYSVDESTREKVLGYLNYTRKTYEIRSQLNVIRKKRAWFLNPLAWYLRMKYRKRKRFVKEIIKSSQFDSRL
jgi:glycosyltransferase involved in cell wall biosynthesis